MERKKLKEFLYEGFGFPVLLENFTFVKKRDIWTPDIDYNKFQKAMLLALCRKPIPLTGNEIYFIRTYFEMTLENFGKHFGLSHAAVLKWEKTKNKPAKMNPTTELCLRLLILEKLNVNNMVFRKIFKNFNMEKIVKENKTPSKAFLKPLPLSPSDIKSSTSMQVAC